MPILSCCAAPSPICSTTACAIIRLAAVGADGLAAHGTGLKLVRQIAEAHGGSTVFSDGDCFRCELRLPLK